MFTKTYFGCLYFCNYVQCLGKGFCACFVETHKSSHYGLAWGEMQSKVLISLSWTQILAFAFNLTCQSGGHDLTFQSYQKVKFSISQLELFNHFISLLFYVNAVLVRQGEFFGNNVRLLMCLYLAMTYYYINASWSYHYHRTQNARYLKYLDFELSHVLREPVWPLASRE